jgi:NO-binding membrane sensor protein with MHYT domain
MNKTAQVVETTETFLLLWALAAVVAGLASHVALGWIQRAQRNPAINLSWPAILIAGATLGTGLCGSSVLMLGGEPLSYVIGFNIWSAVGLWLGAMLGCTLAAYLLSLGERWWFLLGGALVMAAVISLVQYGWINAVGFKPALRWQNEIISAAVVVVIVAVSIAVWVACADAQESSRRRSGWRMGAAVVLALGLVAGQEVMNMASGLLKAKASTFSTALPASILSLVCGVLLPMVLGLLAMDLYSRNHRKRRRKSSFAPKPRGRRRHRGDEQADELKGPVA